MSKNKRRNQSRASLSMARALFLKLPNLGALNHRERKNAVKNLLVGEDDKGKVVKISWPSYLSSKNLTEKWETFWADRKKTVVVSKTAGV